METKMHKKKFKHNQKSSKSNKKLANGNELENVCGILEDEELHSLTHYAGEEEKLVDHMFAAIQGTKLEAMMPGVLKAIPLQDLKLLCVHELRGISKKRIIAIIQGKAMSDSSGSEDEEEEQRKEERPAHGRKRDRRSRRKEGDSRDGLKPGTDGDVEKSLDIVELEMRARLIQTMLKKDPKHKGAVDASELMKATVKSEPMSDRSRSGSYSSSRSRSYTRSRSVSRSCSYSSSGSSYSSGSDGSRRRKRSSHRQSRRDSRRRRQHRRRGGRGSSSKKRGSSRDGSVTPDRHHSDNEEKTKKQATKKTKISRKEFEDRMRKAKETRTYRKRQDSEEEEEKIREENKFEDQERNVAPLPQPMEYEGVRGDKEEGEAESEKEEGEIDSNEEDDKGSTYSGGGGTSKRRPRRHHRRSGSRSSYTSHSSGASDDKSSSKKRRKKSKDSRHSKRRDVRLPVDKNLIIATLNVASSVSKPSDITDKTKPGIEAVDSDEDFDSPSSANLRSDQFEETSKMVPRTDRTNVSFSFNKKPQTNILQGRDLEFGLSYSRPNPYKSQQPRGSDQIVISSDSDHEGGFKQKRPRLQDSGTTAQSHTAIDDDTNTTSPDKEAAHNVSDQSDLKLCEETVMKDIFADIDDEEDARLEIKRELLIKSEPAEADNCRAVSPADVPILSSEIDISSKPIRSRSHSKSSRMSSMECNASDILVKQEMLSPHRVATGDSPPPATEDLVKSEPCYEDPQSQSFCSAYDGTPKNKPKRRKKTNQTIAARRNSENSWQRSVSNSPGMSDCNVQKNFTELQRRKTDEMSHDSEEGACTDQDTDLNGSFVNQSKDDNETPHISNVLDTSGSVDKDVAQHSMEEAPTRNITVSEPSKTFLAENNNREETHNADLSGNLHNFEEDEEDIGLVDLPEDEHFEVDDDDDSQGASNKYVSDLKEMQEEVEDSEVTADNSDFYRGAEGLTFNKEDSRSWADSSVEPDKTREEGQVDDDEEAMQDAGLVELEPEEAEELVTEEVDSAVPVVMQGNTEIIGEIEPSTDGTEELGNLAESGSSWSSRWLQSEKVQKVVSNCKMLSRMRKRIKIDKLNAKTSVAAAAVSAAAVATSSTVGVAANSTEAATSDLRNAEPETVPVIGSMEEYQRMLAEKEPNCEATTGPPDARGDAAEVDVVPEEDSDDSGEDELWSKMMGN